MKSFVTFLKSLLTNSFMLGNGFLSMFGCVCLYIWKWGYFLLAKIPKRSHVSCSLPCSVLICMMMSAASLYCIDGIIFSGLVAWFLWLPGNCIDTDHFRAYYTPNLKIQLIENGILWHLQRLLHGSGVWRAVTLQRYTKVVKNLHSLLFFFSWLLESKEEPNLGYICH